MSDRDDAPPPDPLDQALEKAFEAESVLDTIGRQFGSRPQVLLKDADDGASPVVDPRSSVELDDPRYRTLGEMARGGVGIIFKGIDNDLGREVAIKVLQARHSDQEGIAERFLEEAQIGGQLQHPGIVPVYALSTDRAGKPFFAMKLVRGGTLGALLAERGSPEESRRRLLDIMLRVSRTVAYAHARGIIHRDLKPANIMIGSYGEAQLMDWGFAKVLDREPEARLPGATIVTTLRSHGEGSASIAGSVMGTPAYMPPEQAMGQIDDLDERCDVFALGAILCEVLTGSPPYVGEPADLLLLAAQARLDDAHERLDNCGADAELIALVKECLAPVRGERPSEALRVAQRLEAHLASVEERARKHEIAEAEARSRQKEEHARLAQVELAQRRAEAAAAERKRDAERARRRVAQEKRRAEAALRARRTSIVTAALLLLALLIGGGSYLWSADESRREERARTEQAEAVFAGAVGLAEQGELERAASAAREAARLFDDEQRPRAAALLATCEERLAAHREGEQRVARFRELVQALDEASWSLDGDRDEEMERLVREAGVAFDGDDPAAAAASVPEALRIPLARRMDVWLAERAASWNLGARDRASIAKFATLLDPDPQRGELREAVASGARQRLMSIAGRWSAAEAPHETTALLVRGLMQGFGDVDAARRLLDEAGVHASSNPKLLSAGVTVSLELDPPDLHAAMSLNRRLVSLQPDQADAWADLAYSLGYLGDVQGAKEAATVCGTLAPKSPLPLDFLYRAYMRIGDERGAAATAEELRRRFKRYVWGYLYASALAPDRAQRWRWTELARRVAPDNPYPLLELADLHVADGNLKEAIPLYEEFRQRQPEHAAGALNLAVAYLQIGANDKLDAIMAEIMKFGANDDAAHAAHGYILAKRSRWSEAEAAAQRSLEINEKNVIARRVLARVRFGSGDHEAAFRLLAEANHIRPFGSTHRLAGMFFMERAQYARAHAAFVEATRLRDSQAPAHAALAAFLSGRLDLSMRHAYSVLNDQGVGPLPDVVLARIHTNDDNLDRAAAALVRAEKEIVEGRPHHALASAEFEFAQGRLSVGRDHLERALQADPVLHLSTEIAWIGPGRRHYEWLLSATGTAANEELATAVRAYYERDYAKAVDVLTKSGFESPSEWYFLATACAAQGRHADGVEWANKLIASCAEALASDGLGEQAHARWWLWHLRRAPLIPTGEADELDDWAPMRERTAELLGIPGETK